MTVMNYTVNVDVPDSVIDTVIEQAGYGMRYWAASATQDEENRRYTIRWWEESRLVSDSDYTEPESITVSYDDIVKAMSRIASNEKIDYLYDDTRRAVQDTLVELLSGVEQFPGGEIDSLAADQIVQLAMFRGNRIVFG